MNRTRTGITLPLVALSSIAFAGSCGRTRSQHAPPLASAGADSGQSGGDGSVAGRASAGGTPNLAGNAAVAGQWAQAGESGQPTGGSGSCIEDEACSALGAVCDCANDARPSCATQSRCVDCCLDSSCPPRLGQSPCEVQGSFLVWKYETMECPTDCPASVEAARGKPCGPDGRACQYPGAVSCYCVRERPHVDDRCDQGELNWYCGDFEESGCPAAGVPDVGSDCSAEGTVCLRAGQRCSDGYGRACRGGTWTEQPPLTGEDCL